MARRPGVLQSIVADNEHLDLFSAISIGMNYFAFNVRYAPFDDVTFRQAIAHTIPQEFIIDNIFNGLAAPADSFVSAALGILAPVRRPAHIRLQH